MPSWNKKQQEVLDSINDNRNILVSAAAGSGKTAVLVERISDMVEMGLAEIDEILVVTFTKAAAAQMKGKIIKKLEEKASLSPEGSLAGQLLKAEDADIMTIDSFCNKIVRENFSIVGMDPAFEIYDNEEVKLLKDDVLDSVLEKHYKDDETARELAGFMMSRSIDDEELKSTILRIASISESFADPDKWLDNAYHETEAESISESRWFMDYNDYLVSLANEALWYFSERKDEFEGMRGSENQDVINKITEMYDKDIDTMRAFINADTLVGRKDALPDRWPQFPAKKLGEIIDDQDQIDQLKADREAIKGVFKTVYTEDDIKDELVESSVYIRSLIELVRDFRSELMSEKTKQKRYEFNDVAHAAYRILFDSEKNERTEVGSRVSGQYKYIYIDEYQDSSDLQESILNSVARYDEEGYPANVFMVGDVKQSIYRFRMAKPELFNQKADMYGKDEHGRLINLNMNYRSRGEVLDATNYVMQSVMRRTFGGIEYSEDVKLNRPDDEVYFDNYPEAPEGINVGGKPEVCMIDVGKHDPEDGPILIKDDYKPNPIEDAEKRIKQFELTHDEFEAIKIGEIIREIIYGNPDKGKEPAYVLNENYNPNKPESEKNSRYRRARFGDIVILQRAVKGSTPMVRIYEKMGIPVIVDDPSGYFEAIEVMTIMSVLRVIDNIQQDIPLASVLLSNIGGLTDSELATVVSLSPDPKMSLADKCINFCDGYKDRTEEPELMDIAEKLGRVFEMIDGWSGLRPYIDIATLIDHIIADTQYDCFVAAMPEGRRRAMNLKLLRYRALSFETGRNVGLLDFIRYIDKCAMKEMEFSEAQIMDDVENMVHITSIHKSKGLEYPIVIVARTGKGFMLRDMSKPIVSDSDYYISMDRLKVSKSGIMLRQQSVRKSIIKLLSDKASMAEEARLLYVAMTRAKEKLYITGTYKKGEAPLMILNKSLMAYLRFAFRTGNVEDYLVTEEIEGEALADSYDKKYRKQSADYAKDIMALREAVSDELEHLECEETGTNPYDYRYPFEKATREKSKRSVSEIKHMEMQSHMEIRDDSDEIITDGHVLDEMTAGEKATGEKASGKKVFGEEVSGGAKRGTITHEIFERLDYGRVSSRDDLIAEFERILSDERYSDEERMMINKAFLANFYSEDENSLFMRMRHAFLEGKLYREKQFITGKDIDEGSDDFVIVQGIIDAFFYEDGEIVLVDYKTDAVKTPKELLDRYESQMYLYATTLENLTGHRVKDVILYSTRLGEVSYPEWRAYKLGDF